MSPSAFPLPATEGRSTFDPGVRAGHVCSDCQFCRIARIYAPYDPSRPPPADSPVISPEATLPNPASFVVLSTPLLIAFLDIMPLSFGHVLLCPRAHRNKLTDVSAAEAREMGCYLRVLSGAVGKATGIHDWNVVQNNGAAAAQVVPHMHFHIIPRPELKDRGRESFTATMFGRGKREDLDEEEAAPLAARIREAVAEMMAQEKVRDLKL